MNRGTALKSSSGLVCGEAWSTALGRVNFPAEAQLSLVGELDAAFCARHSVHANVGSWPNAKSRPGPNTSDVEGISDVMDRGSKRRV